MDATVYAPFCIPLRQRPSHAAARPGEEGGVPPKPLSSPSQPHSSRTDSLDEDCSHTSSAMDVMPVEVENFPTFVPRASPRKESSNDDQAALPKIVPISAPQAMVITGDNRKGYVLKSVTSYVPPQTTPIVPQTLSEILQPSLPPPHLIPRGPLATAPSLPLPPHSFSVPATDSTTRILPAPLPAPPQASVVAHPSYFENKTREPQRLTTAKELPQEGRFFENVQPRRIRLKTPEGPAAGQQGRTAHGRPGWHDSGSRQSALLYSGPGGAGAARFYTKPAPSLPLLPLAQTTFGRNPSRRFMIDSFPSETSCYESESFGESALHAFQSGNEGNDQAYNSCYAGNLQSIAAASSIVQSTYSGANITYTAAGTAPPPKTFRGDPDQVVICSSTNSGRTVTYPYASGSTYTHAENNPEHGRMSARGGLYESAVRSKFTKKTYSSSSSSSTNDASVSANNNGSSQKKEDNQPVVMVHHSGEETSSAEDCQQICKQDNQNIVTTTTTTTTATMMTPTTTTTPSRWCLKSQMHIAE